MHPTDNRKTVSAILSRGTRMFCECDGTAYITVPQALWAVSNTELGQGSFYKQY